MAYACLDIGDSLFNADASIRPLVPSSLHGRFLRGELVHERVFVIIRDNLLLCRYFGGGFTLRAPLRLHVNSFNVEGPSMALKMSRSGSIPPSVGDVKPP